MALNSATWTRPPARVQNLVATKIRRVKHQLSGPYRGRSEGLRIYFNDGTAEEIWCTHVMDLFEPNWAFFWPDTEKQLNKELSSRRGVVVSRLARITQKDPCWGRFYKCSLEAKGKKIRITMPGANQRGGDVYELRLEDLLRGYVKLNKFTLPNISRRNLRIASIANNKKRGSLTLRLSSGDTITLDPHDVLSLCDYRYENYLFN